MLSAPSRVDRGGGGSVGSEAIRVAHRRRVWFAEPRADPPPPGTVMLPAVRLGAGVAPVSARESLHPWRLPPHQRFAEFKTARGRPSGGLESDTLDRKPEPLGLTSSFYIRRGQFQHAVAYLLARRRAGAACCASVPSFLVIARSFLS